MKKLIHLQKSASCATYKQASVKLFTKMLHHSSLYWTLTKPTTWWHNLYILHLIILFCLLYKITEGCTVYSHSNLNWNWKKLCKIANKIIQNIIFFSVNFKNTTWIHSFIININNITKQHKQLKMTSCKKLSLVVKKALSLIKVISSF